MAKIEIRTRFSSRVDDGIQFIEPSLTQQHFKDECDITYVLNRCMQNGFPPAPEAIFEDVSDIPTNFEEVSAIFEDASARFALLPSSIRDMYGNNMRAFYSDVSAHPERLSELGLVSPSQEGVSPSGETVSTPPLDVTVLTDTKTKKRTRKKASVESEVSTDE